MARRVLDFHVHIGDSSQLRQDIYALLARGKGRVSEEVEGCFGAPDRLVPFLVSEGIWKAVVLAEEGPGTNFHVNNGYVARFVHRDSSATLIAFGGINPRQAAPSTAYDEAIALGARGFKLYPADHDFDPCHPDLMDVYGRMAAARVPIMFHTGHTAQADANHDYCNPLVFAPIMRAIPSLCVILCHAGMPAFTEEARWCLAHFPNCYIDTAIVPASTLAQRLPVAELAERIVFGSDWPATSSPRAAWSAFEQLDLSPDAITKILCENGSKILTLLQ